MEINVKCCIGCHFSFVSIKELCGVLITDSDSANLACNKSPLQRLSLVRLKVCVQRPDFFPHLSLVINNTYGRCSVKKGFNPCAWRPLLWYFSINKILSILAKNIKFRRKVSSLISLCGLKRLILVDTLRTCIKPPFHRVRPIYKRGSAVRLIYFVSITWTNRDSVFIFLAYRLNSRIILKYNITLHRRSTSASNSMVILVGWSLGPSLCNCFIFVCLL